MAANEEKRKPHGARTEPRTRDPASWRPCGTAVRRAPADLPRLYRVRVPLPHNPLQALNSYIVLGDETTTIIDVGFNHPACEKALDKALESLGRTWDTVEIVLTHSHPDHTGNLDRIYRDGMRVYANLHSFKEVENLNADASERVRPLLRQGGARRSRAGSCSARASIACTYRPSCCR